MNELIKKECRYLIAQFAVISEGGVYGRVGENIEDGKPAEENATNWRISA